MTSINKLTQTPSLEDNDLSVVWQNSSGRTRAITIANLRKFIQSTDPNADAFVKAELVGDELILTSHDETETKIDINILPSHSVTELNDMPDSLVSGHYLKVNDAGTDFVLTPASEISAEVILQESGVDQGAANVLNFDGLSVEVVNRIAKISSAPLSAADGELMKVEGGKFVPSGVMSKKDGSLSLSSGSVDIGPHTISSSGEGIEATNESTGESYSFVFAGQGDDAGPVDRIFGDASVIKTTDDLSLQLVNHVSKLTATGKTRVIKQPITIKPVSAQTNVTMQITDLNGSDLWTHGPFDIDIDQSGDFQFTISTVLDFNPGEYLVTFLSPDGDVTLFGGISPISGEEIVYGELPLKPFHDETLHNIKQGGDIVRTVEAGSNVILDTDENGKLTISSTGGGSALDVDGNETESIETGSGIKSTYDAPAKKTTLEVDVNDLDLSAYAKLASSNSFTAQQKVVNAEFKVEKSDGTNLLRVRTDNETVTVRGALTSDEVKSLSFDSGQSSDLEIKHNGNTKLFVGASLFTSTVKIQAQKGIEIQDNSTYTGSIDNDDSLVNKKYVDDANVPAVYDGEGFGVPGRTETGQGTIVQTVVTGNYRNTSNDTGDLIINLRTDDGVTNFRFYYSLPFGTLSGRKVFAKVDQKAGSSKTIRAGEIWQCEIKAGRYFDDFFWQKITDGESTFAIEEINNQATVDLICKTRYGNDCIYLNTLTAEV